jgi:hypothetical protein
MLCASPVSKQSVCSWPSPCMSLMDQVAALRKFFQPPSEAPLPMQVAMMNEQMGIDGEGTLRARCPSRSTSSVVTRPLPGSAY